MPNELKEIAEVIQVSCSSHNISIKKQSHVSNSRFLVYTYEMSWVQPPDAGMMEEALSFLIKEGDRKKDYYVPLRGHFY